MNTITRRLYLDNTKYDVTITGEPLESTGFVMNISYIDDILEAAYYSTDFTKVQTFLDECLSFVNYWDDIKRLVYGAEIYSIKRYNNSNYHTFTYKDKPMIYETRCYDFCAAHYLHNENFSSADNKKLFNKCNNMHGHNFTLSVAVRGVFSDKEHQIIKDEIIERYDHEVLNNFTEFENKIPTTENFTYAIWKILKPQIVNLHCVSVRETNKNFFQYYGDKNPDATFVGE